MARPAMTAGTPPRRCVVGRDVIVIEESPVDVYVESTLRLRAGTWIELVGEPSGLAYLCHWMVARLGRDGPVFRGSCRWTEIDG